MCEYFLFLFARELVFTDQTASFTQRAQAEKSNGRKHEAKKKPSVAPASPAPQKEESLELDLNFDILERARRRIAQLNVASQIAGNFIFAAQLKF